MGTPVEDGFLQGLLFLGPYYTLTVQAVKRHMLLDFSEYLTHITQEPGPDCCLVSHWTPWGLGISRGVSP